MYFVRRVHAAGFAAGNIVVYRIGDGTTALSGNAAPVFLDEYTPAGVLVQSIALPTAVNGSNRRLTSSGTATNEGMLTRSGDGQYIVLTGYDAAVGTASIATSTSSTVQRIVGRVDASGNIDTTTVFAGTAGNSFSGSGIRSVASDSGTNLWAVGAASGVQYITLGSTSSTQVSSTVTNLRGTSIFGGQLYISTASGTTVRVGTVGTGTPTTTGQTITNLPGFPTTGSPNEFFFADLSAGVPGVDTLYVADDSPGTIQKYSLSGGSWVANGSVTAAAVRGLTATVQGTTVTLFGATGGSGASGGGSLYKFVDSTGYNVSISGTATTIASAGTNKVFRGVALVPGGPPNQAIVPNCPASLNTVQGSAASTGVSASDPDGTVTSASITSAAVPGITLGGFTAASGVGGTASATLNVSNATASGTYNVTIQYQNNDPTPQTATCTVVVTVTPPNQPITPSCPGSLNVDHGSAGATNVSASDPDGMVTNASITSTPVAGITLDSLTPAGAVGGTASATLNVANTTAVGTYNVNIQWTNNDSPTPQTANCTVVVTVQPVAPTNNVVISQVYGGGGNSGSTLKNDYIELINHSSAPVNLNGWSVQAFVSTTNSWQVTPLTNFTLQPGQYYLVQESAQGGGTDDLPTPDAIGSIPVSSTSTKVALVNNTTTITAACPSAAAAGIVDLVGYGGTDCFEGSGTAPLLTNTTADLRLNEGCFDTNDNSVDFVSGAPNPRNSSFAVHDCTGLSATGSANPSTVLQGNSTTLTVHVAPGQNPTSSGISVSADLSLIGGSANQSFGGSGTTFTFFATVPANNPSGIKSLPVTVTDGQGRTANTNILVSVLSTIPEHVTISQVYGGGGNSGATYSNDYVELYNPTASPISMTGWSLQYGSATGTSFSGKTVLGGTIDPGHYYLISLASGGSTGASLPPASVNGDINMSATTGKIVLVRNSDTLIGACPLGTDPDIVDFVGYGTANCHEGTANAPAPSNTTAIFRKTGGGTDTDQNGNDFITGVPNPRSTTPVIEFGPSVAGTDPTTNATTAPYDSSITADFSEPVDAVGVWYNVACTNTGLHTEGTVAHSNDFKTWAFTPNATFQFGEQCTATIYKDQIHDQDTNDSEPGTDTLSADYVWSFTVVGAGQAAPYPPSVHLTMGNPNNAVADVGQPNNYLMMKPTYALSYNRDKGTPNWVSWHLDSSWYGSLARVDTFRPDPAVPADWYRVQAFDFSGTGFDRGHMTPNADRDNQNRVPINQETYLMSNMVPQSPDNNQGPWAALEAYLRSLTDAGNELYIVSGPAGIGGTGSNGGVTTTIAGGHVTVPASTWKVVLVLPKQDGDDVSRVSAATRTIAVLMPNTQGIRNNDWTTYLTTVDAIEQLTGYDFFSNVPAAIQNSIEAGTNGANPPGTTDAGLTTLEDTPGSIVLSAVSPDSNATFTYTVSQPSHGAVSCAGANCTYTPAADFNGSDSFTFKANDGHANSNTSTVSITVTEANDPPVPTNDDKVTDEDTALTFSSSDLTANDSAGPANESGQALTVTAVNATADTHGTVSLDSGQVTYTPAANFNGPASFTYQVCDNGTTSGSSDSKCATATVNVSVASVNDAPVANNDSATTDEDTPANIAVLGNDTDVDGDGLSVAAVTQGAHGAVSINGNGTVTYSPALNFNGNDSFTYTASDGNGGTATATVSVTVNSVNDAPVAVGDSATTDEDTPTTVNVLANDTDADGDNLSVTAVTQGAHGVVTNNGNGTVTYSPAQDFNGMDSFTYTVSDGHGGTNTASVNVQVNPVNDAPVLSNVPALVSIPELSPYTFTASASDVDSTVLTFSLVNAPGGASITQAGQFNWTPTEAQGGPSNSYTFKVAVSDGIVTVEKEITINVSEVNQTPVLNTIADQTLYLGNTLTFTAIATDADLPAQTLTYSLTGAVPSGATISSAGVFTWTPTASQVGNIYTFNVKVMDNSGSPNNSVEQTIHVAVGYTWGGPLSPISSDGSSVFKIGRTIPVKFKLTGASAGISTAVARLSIAKVADNVVGTPVDADATGGANDGNLFRYDPTADQYIFNLNTKGLSPGTYRLFIDMGDGVQRFITFGLN